MESETLIRTQSFNLRVNDAFGVIALDRIETHLKEIAYVANLC